MNPSALDMLKTFYYTLNSGNVIFEFSNQISLHILELHVLDNQFDWFPSIVLLHIIDSITISIDQCLIDKNKFQSASFIFFQISGSVKLVFNNAIFKASNTRNKRLIIKEHSAYMNKEFDQLKGYH
jgi:hypothetical protein